MSMSKEELVLALAVRAQQDSSFKEKLVTNPAAAVAEVTGVAVPDNVTVRVFEDSATQVNLVLPATPADGGKLSDRELAATAGGGGKTDCSWGATCVLTIFGNCNG